jgi:N-acetylglucosamine-6-phosphate deacetylase
LVDPVDGLRPGRLVLDGGTIVGVEEGGAAEEPLLLPGFVDLHVYESAGLVRQGVTAYLQAAQEPRATTDALCLGLHLEGPFLNPKAAGAIPVEAIRPVDLDLLDDWLGRGDVRLVTVAPEIPGGLEAIALVSERAVAGVGHTLANAATAKAAVALGARFATHLWNATSPVRARATGVVPELLLEPRVTIGLIADGRHLHPRIEELTLRVAGAARVALTSDLVVAPGHFPDGRLAGGDRAGAALVRRMARFGLAEAAAMASFTPSRLLGLADRGRLAPGFRADIAVLSRRLEPLETLVGGEIAWSVRYPQTAELDEIPPSTHAPGSGA